MAKATYVPLWCETNYSFLEGASFPDEQITRAAELGLSAVGIADKDGMYGVVRAHAAAREEAGAGKELHLLIGYLI